MKAVIKPIFFLLLLSVFSCSKSISKSVHKTRLNSNWSFKEVGAKKWLSATVPGCVHTDLINNEINIENKNEANSFSDLFGSKNVPKDIRKIVDEETLGISLSERRGIDILFGDIPETGVVIDAKKEALRIRKNKSSGQKLNSTPSPALDINSGKSLLIK